MFVLIPGANSDNTQNRNVIINHDYAKKPLKQKQRMKITQLRALYNCKRCGYRTMYKGKISQHECQNTPSKSKLKAVPCTNCNTKVNPRMIDDGYEHCPKCTYFTTTKVSLKIHMHIHSRGNPFKCTECSFSASNLQELIAHCKETKDLICNCGFSTHFRDKMEAHQRITKGEVKHFM